MGKIPIYTSNEKLISQSPLAQRSPQAEGQFGRDLQGAGEGLTQAVEGIRKAYEIQQVGSAKLITAKGMAEIEAEAAQDGNNTGDLAPYQEKMRQVKANALKEISNPATKAQFEMDFDESAIHTEVRIKQGFWQNVKNKSIANLNELGTMTIEQYSIKPEKPDPGLLESYNKNVDIYVNSGIINEVDAQKMKENTAQSARYNKFQLDLLRNRKQAEEDFKAGKYGLTTENQIRAETKIRANTQEMRIAQEETRGIANVMLTSGELTEGWIDEQVKANKFDPLQGFNQKIGDSLKKALYGDVKQRMTTLTLSNKTAAKYKKAIDTIFTGSNRDRMAAYDSVLDAYSDGAISKDEASFFNSLIKTQKDIKFNQKTGPIEIGIRAFKSMFGFGAFAQSNSLDGIRNAMLKIQNGAEPTIAFKETMVEEIKKNHPGAVVDDKIPPSMYGKNGFSNVIPTQTQTKSAFTYSKGSGMKKKEAKE